MEQSWYKSLKFDKICTDYLSEGYDPMNDLKEAAHKIREVLLDAEDDELHPEHCMEAAKIVLGSPSDWTEEEYNRMLASLAFIFQKFTIVSMN